MIMTKKKSIAGVIVFLVSLTVYLATVCPTVYVGDSGEMITAAFFLGIPHPPGYPLFCLIGKALSFLPISTIAYRINLVAVLFGALTVSILFQFLSKLFLDLGQKGQIFPLACALLFAFSKTFWAQALMAKGALYTINAFFIITLIYMIYSNRNNMTKINLILIALVNGLGLANHNTIAPLSFLFLEQTRFYFSYLSDQMTPIFVLIAVPGAAALFKFSKKLFSILLITFLLTGFGLLLLSNPQKNAIDKFTLEVFFIPSYFVFTVTILFGTGLIQNM